MHRSADARQAGADDQHVQFLGLLAGLCRQQECRGGAHRAARFGQLVHQLPDMGHAGIDLQVHGHAGFARLLRQADRIVTQQFRLTHVDQQRRQAGQVAEQGRGQWLGRAGACQVGLAHQAQLRRLEHRIAPGVEGDRRAAARQVQRGREQRRRGRQGLVGVAQGQHQAQGQVAAGAVARHHDSAGRRLGAQGAVDRQRILRCRRERVFRRQTVIRCEHPHALQCESARQRPVRAWRAGDESPAMQVQQRGARARACAWRVNLSPFARHTANDGAFEAHALGRGQWLGQGRTHRSDIGRGQGGFDVAAHKQRGG